MGIGNRNLGSHAITCEVCHERGEHSPTTLQDFSESRRALIARPPECTVRMFHPVDKNDAVGLEHMDMEGKLYRLVLEEGTLSCSSCRREYAIRKTARNTNATCAGGRRRAGISGPFSGF